MAADGEDDMVKMAEWPGDTGSLGEWAQEQLDLLGASEAAMYGADLEDGQHLWVAADLGPTSTRWCQGVPGAAP